jgi:pimeloyl-ACP methyl ester carboxylesterase
MLLSSIGSPLDFLAEGSEMEIVDGTGHFLHVEQPDLVNRRIIGFLTNS